MNNSRLAIAAVLFAAAPLFGGCATADQVQALEQKVDTLEKKVADLESRPAAAGGGAAGVDPKLEEAAQELYKSITDDVQNGDLQAAATKAKDLSTKYASTTTFKRARKMLSELEVIGVAIPGDWSGSVEEWYQGDGQVDLTTGTTMVVFWEVWCPHCRNHMPELVGTYDKWKGKGMNVVGLTRLTKGKTKDDVLKFMDENKLNYPIGKEDGKLARIFGVGGIPAAAVVKDGKIVWRGHPARLSEDVIEKLL
jgi:thiol-disulfide isomerase/thioredoxin